MKKSRFTDQEIAMMVWVLMTCAEGPVFRNRPNS